MDVPSDYGGIRVSFLLDTFLLTENCSCIFGIRHIPVACQTKESIAVVGSRTDI